MVSSILVCPRGCLPTGSVTTWGAGCVFPRSTQARLQGRGPRLLYLGPFPGWDRPEHQLSPGAKGPDLQGSRSLCHGLGVSRARLQAGLEVQALAGGPEDPDLGHECMDDGLMDSKPASSPSLSRPSEQHPHVVLCFPACSQMSASFPKNKCHSLGGSEMGHHLPFPRETARVGTMLWGGIRRLGGPGCWRRPEPPHPSMSAAVSLPSSP